MSGLIGAGKKSLALANFGMQKVASADVQEEIQREQMEAANIAGKQQLIGQVGGVGAGIGAKEVIGMAKEVKTAKAGLTAAKEANEAAQTALKLAETTELASGTGGALTTNMAATEAATTVAAGTAEAAAVAEAGVATAGAASGPMAQVAAMAGPVAIALGVGFLLTKLFD
tara:strand:+ start:1173 stop:1685 length:513 start_codon:yes stop_codon:yes gene_type:complete